MVNLIPEWFKIKSLTQYCDVSERTCRSWLKKGLRFTRLPSGMILIKRSWIDEFLAEYEHSDNQVDDIVEGVIKEIQ